MLATWPPVLDALLRTVQGVFSFFGTHRLAGIPLDLPARFAVLGSLYLLLRIRMSGIRAALLCVTLLFASEFVELICPRCHGINPPNGGDLVDVISGLAGIAAAEGIRRVRRRRPA